MSRLDRAIRMFGACAGVAAVLTGPGSAAGLELPRDGWVSWEVAAVDRAPAWCCWRSRLWSARAAIPTSPPVPSGCRTRGPPT